MARTLLLAALALLLVASPLAHCGEPPCWCWEPVVLPARLQAGCGWLRRPVPLGRAAAAQTHELSPASIINGQASMPASLVNPSR